MYMEGGGSGGARANAIASSSACLLVVDFVCERVCCGVPLELDFVDRQESSHVLEGVAMHVDVHLLEVILVRRLERLDLLAKVGGHAVRALHARMHAYTQPRTLCRIACQMRSRTRHPPPNRRRVCVAAAVVN